MQLLTRAYAINLIQGLLVLGIRVLDSYLLQPLHIWVANEIVPALKNESKRIRCNTYIDVGAHTGDTLLPVVDFFNTCVAIEPDPRNLPLLKKAAQNLKNCIILDCVLSDSEGQMPMFN